MSETETLESEPQEQASDKNEPELSGEQTPSEQESASTEEIAPESTQESDNADIQELSDDQQHSQAPRYKTIKAEPEKIEPIPLKDIKMPDIPELQRILKLQVPVIVRLAEKTMRVSDILDMNPGIIIEFDKTVDEPLDLMINNKCIGKGQTVKIGENFGLKITKITSLGQIIQAMGQDE